MFDHPSWRLLPVAVPGIPNLLVSTVFAPESYTLHLTDLANVWTESMERKPIIKRGLVEDTSIDPSDGPDQLRRMLELLRAAFDLDDAEHANTSLSIGTDKDDSLLIQVTCILPKPLKPFKWPMHLSKRPHSVLATELVLPLIQAHEARACEIDTLVVALREKDAIITRLVDKLEATGTGLEHVFNPLSGKRKVTRAIAEGGVKGLAPFSEADFRNKASELQVTTGLVDVTSLLDGVFGVTGITYRSDMGLEASPILNDWWTKLGQGKNIVLADRSRTRKTSTPVTSQTVGTKTEDDDGDFQVQATPPGLSSARKRGPSTRPAPVDDDETTDGEDDEISDTLPLPSSSLAKSSGARIGALGKHKNPTSSPPQATTSPRLAQGKGKQVASDTGSETASDDEHGTTSPPHLSPPKPPPRRGGLGRIGGRPRETTPVAEPTRSPSLAVTKEPSSPPRRHKLGMIGKNIASAESVTQAESRNDDTRGRSSTPATASNRGLPRETSQERADRKRAELQKDLERRAAAGPTKKKRKF
ncbi:XRCC4-like factor-domain-containing protein [Lasiosphaeria hispida]|uniref:Non-homologous end-joining factor 1 n=1 Tax=Lasiosphaeria hispida TaxID=260671 RepID=A0AAJ0H759_9PEZI|nr:XRCC4-like factor-domain-containing protein [Lasiosphaeria hispida]